MIKMYTPIFREEPQKAHLLGEFFYKRLYNDDIETKDMKNDKL